MATKFCLYWEFDLFHAQFYVSWCHGFNPYASLCAKHIYKQMYRIVLYCTIRIRFLARYVGARFITRIKLAPHADRVPNRVPCVIVVR